MSTLKLKLKWWINSISMAIARTRTASRNVAFKVAMMRDDFIMEGQHEFIMRRTESTYGYGLESRKR